ncbi:GerAB/ArcD/ProY family transporter [Metabacillus sediminilitoris]|nr:endospore germination permease [Metabacillus sediminilitoris]
MLEKGKINATEFQLLVIVFTIGSSVLTSPSQVTKIVKQDAWITSALTVLISLFFIYLYNKIADLYPSMTFIECLEKVFGKWLGKIAALIFLFYLYYLTAGVLREIGNFFTTQILVETPIEIIMILFLLTVLYGVRLGLEVIVRTALIFYPWIIFLLLMLFLFLIPEIKLENVQPILEAGLKPFMKATYNNLSIPYNQLIILLMVAPYVNEKKQMKRAFYKGTLFGGLVITLIILFSILVLGAENSARQSYPSFILGKKINIGGFLERIEAIVAIIWILTVYFKISICYYSLSNGLANVLGLKSHQILMFPLFLLIISFSIIAHPDMVHFQHFLAKTWPHYSFTICLFLPLLVVIIGKLSKKISAAKSS